MNHYHVSCPLSLTHRNHAHRTYKFTFVSLPRLSPSTAPLQDDFALSRVHAHSLSHWREHTRIHTLSFLLQGKTKGKQYAHTQLASTQPGHSAPACSSAPIIAPPPPLALATALTFRNRRRRIDLFTTAGEHQLLARDHLVPVDTPFNATASAITSASLLKPCGSSAFQHNCCGAWSTRLQQTSPKRCSYQVARDC